jgi:hypothetical protein
VPDVRNTAGSAGAGTQDMCDVATAHLLHAFLGGPYGTNNPGDYAGWRFDAPPDTTIWRATVRWYGWAHTAGNLRELTLETSRGTPPIYHLNQFDGSDTVEVADGSWIRVEMKCGDDPLGTQCQPDPDPVNVSFVQLRASTVTLIDRLTPAVESASGPAVSDSLWYGAEPLAFSASDRGGGVYRVLVEVDGTVAAGLPAADDPGCVDQTGARDFGSPVPCPPQLSATVAIDAASLPAGDHTIGVYVEDASGNRAALIPPVRKRILSDYRDVGYYVNGQFFNPRFAAPRVLNGNGATAGAKLTAAFARRVGKGRARHRVLRAAREVRYAQRATVVGKLTAPSGEPISGATVFVGQQPEGQQWRLDGSVRTNTRGEFRYRPPARQSNRQLRAVYFPFSDSHESAVSRALRLGVRAGMTLQVNRHRLRNGERLVFSGRVLGPVPAAGVAVTLQAKVGRHYRSFRQLRATSATKGRIHTVYRFERTTRPARYRFRLKVVRQAGLPFQSGVSPVVRVSVTP